MTKNNKYTNESNKKKKIQQINDIKKEILNLTKDQQCVYDILSKEKTLSTKQLIDIALTKEYNGLCQGCASADNVIRAVQKLQDIGIVNCKLTSKGYFWEYNNQ